MSIDRRLREGLEANTSGLLPQVDHELGAVLRRAGRRGRARLAAVGLVTATALATAGWLVGASNVDRSEAPPSNPDDGTSEPVEMATVRGALTPGEYAVPLWGDPGASGPKAVVDVPPGYFSPGGWVIDAGSEGQDTDRGNLSFWNADQVVGDPCAWDSTTGPLGPTARDLTTALTRQPGHLTSEPEPVTIDGHDGFHLKVRLPRDTDLTKCDLRKHVLWKYGDAFYFHLGREDLDTTTHLWILDVDGRRVVIVALLSPDQERGQNAELLEMARGTRFVQTGA